MKRILLTVAIVVTSLLSAQAQVVFSEDFEGVTPPALPAGWAHTEPAGAGVWETTAPGIAMIMFNSADNDSWLFSSGIPLTGGQEYTLSFWLYKEGDGAGELFEVKMGTTQDVSGMTTVLFPNSGRDYIWEEIKVAFTPTTTGTYYLGFHDFTSYEDAWSSAFDDVAITVGNATGFTNTNADSDIIRYEYYNMNGAQLKEKPAKGFYIEQGIRENGTRTSRTMGAF